MLMMSISAYAAQAMFDAAMLNSMLTCKLNPNPKTMK